MGQQLQDLRPEELDEILRRVAAANARIVRHWISSDPDAARQIAGFKAGMAAGVILATPSY